MVAALGGKKALLMGHHGSLHVGDTLERVTMEALVMELCAGYQLAAMAVGGKPLDARDRGELPQRLPEERLPRADVDGELPAPAAQRSRTCSRPCRD